MIDRITQNDVALVEEFSIRLKECLSLLKEVLSLRQAIAATKFDLISQEDLDRLQDFLKLGKSE